MYTQCPNCSTIFDIEDEDLDAQQGLARCGCCQEVFNTSWHLVAALPGGEQPGIVIAPDEVVGKDQSQHAAPDDSSEARPAPAAGIPVDKDAGPPPKWTVSELDDPVATGPAGGATGEEAITETLSVSDIATTDEVEKLLEPEVPATPERAGPGAGKQARPVTPADVDEEIVIEAPVNLWNINDEREDIESAPKAPGERPGLPGLKKPEPRVIPIARPADDVKLVQIPDPKPMRTVAWALAGLVLVVAALWQLKQYYIAELAEVASLRGPLETVCVYVSCTVPPRTNIKRIDLVSTSVDPHPATPGALRVSANLINRAVFEQPFPPLEVTLTDKAGEVVGRRTYLPHEYRSGPPGDMSPNVLERADLDLAQPAHSAVGYEIQLVAR